MPSLVNLVSAGLLVLLLPALAPAQEVIREITGQRLEDLLRGMDISYKRGDLKKGDSTQGISYYDFQRNQRQETLRLWNYHGKDLMMDVILPKAEWETVNTWNSLAKFSRAHVLKNDKDKTESVVLESNLDLTGGVTIDAIRHFINRFDDELLRWVNKQVGGGAGEEDIFTNVGPDRMERILKNMKIEFTKKQANTSYYYYFKRNGYNLMVSNFGGADLMVSCNFDQTTLAKINDWNAKRSCARAVQYEENGRPYTTLESNLDCVAGTTESIIRNLIEAFDADVKAFDAHLGR